MKKIWKEYFSFSKKERIAVWVLLLFITLFMVLPYLIPDKGELPVIDPLLQAFVLDRKNNYAEKDSNELPEPNIDRNIKMGMSVFPFDPNLITWEEWRRLGLSSRTATTILNYRNKGGRFKHPEDLRKIWGLSGKDAERLIPFVRIAVYSDLREANLPKRIWDSTNRFHEKKLPVLIDINTADPENWKALPGIGDVLANRIVHYRERIGGFGKPEQVKKVFGITDSLFQRILPYLEINPSTLPKLDLNRVTAYELADRTGISQDVAKAIVVFRQQYGAYRQVTDLRKIVFINDSLFSKIMPYVIISYTPE